MVNICKCFFQISTKYTINEEFDFFQGAGGKGTPIHKFLSQLFYENIVLKTDSAPLLYKDIHSVYERTHNLYDFF